MPSNALDVPLSLAQCSLMHDELSPKPTMDTVNTHFSMRTVAFMYDRAESPKKDT